MYSAPSLILYIGMMVCGNGGRIGPFKGVLTSVSDMPPYTYTIDLAYEYTHVDVPKGMYWSYNDRDITGVCE